MKLTLPKFSWPTWSRTTSGDNFYDITSVENWTGNMTTLDVAQNHPILTPAILFVAKLFSQAEFYSVDNKGNKKKRDSAAIKLLNDPNPYQTKEDFLETLMFVMIAQGVAIVAQEKIIGFEEPRAMYVLNKDLITWPENFDKEKFKKYSKKDLKDKYIIYDKDGENIRYSIANLMFFYDLANGLQRNPFKVKSRIDGLMQTLINTMDSLVAKNIILKSNGKELVTGKREGFPLSPEEKKAVEELFNNKLGLSHTRKRGVVTKAELSWKSLHIALRDLGLDESVKIDGNLIYTALHIPKDILSLEAKKTTYNNFKESMVSYIQNEMQASLNSFVSVFNKHYNDGTRLVGSFEHLPIMQFILLERYEVVAKQAAALHALISVGLPKETALEMCGLDPGLELQKMQPEQTQNQNDNGQGESEKQIDWPKVRRIG